MTSAIDPTKPVFGAPTTNSVRANFAAAKAEIEALQAIARPTGFADYNDYATSLAALSVAATTWTRLPNDGLGANGRVALPAGIARLWNTATSQLDLTACPVNSMIDVRLDLAVTTTTANQIVRLRADLGIGGASAFSLEGAQTLFKTAGAYSLVHNMAFYIGSTALAAAPGEFRIYSDATATVRVNGWYIRITKAA
jgi:hypothetical protein